MVANWPQASPPPMLLLLPAEPELCCAVLCNSADSVCSSSWVQHSVAASQHATMHGAQQLLQAGCQLCKSCVQLLQDVVHGMPLQLQCPTHTHRAAAQQ